LTYEVGQDSRVGLWLVLVQDRSASHENLVGAVRDQLLCQWRGLSTQQHAEHVNADRICHVAGLAHSLDRARRERSI